MQIDYLIIGQGISGSFLSYYLFRENRSFIVIDNNATITPSKVSAGIINPVTGRRMVKVWLAEEVLSFTQKAYNDIGNLLGITALTQKNLIDFFPNVHQRQVFMERIDENEEYLHSFPEQNQFNNYFNYDLGCGEIRNCYLAHLEVLLPSWRQKLTSNGQLLEEEFEIENLLIEENSVYYKDIKAKKVIFCDGLASYGSPYFRQLPFAPNKGEILILEIPDLPGPYIYKKGFVLCPLNQPGLFWFGSNYLWNFPDALPTKQFYEQAERHLKAWLRVPFKILNHKAALRPATLERRPFVGMHPHQRNVGILNGMGTKGCSLAPYFAYQLVQNLLYNQEINAHAHINRFQKILAS